MSTQSARRVARDDRLDRVFGALSDRTRRALLSRLQRAPAGITELAEPFDMSLPAVSKHVRVLERAGLVRRSIDGRVHRCALDPAPLHDAQQWLSDRRELWEDALDALAQFVDRSRRSQR
jgi:DNA-binding transcriptional ArsR family regulator